MNSGYMEGEAVTDIIENNSLDKDQVSSICLEVSKVITDDIHLWLTDQHWYLIDV